MQKSFSLIELVVYIGLFVLMAIFLIIFSVNFLKQQREELTENNLISSVADALDFIVYEIRESDAVYASTSVFKLDNSQLSLITTKNLPIGETSTYEDFYLSNHHLFLKRESQNPILLTPADINISRFFVENIFATTTFESLRISITAEATSSYGGILKYSATTTAAVR